MKSVHSVPFCTCDIYRTWAGTDRNTNSDIFSAASTNVIDYNFYRIKICKNRWVVLQTTWTPGVLHHFSWLNCVGQTLKVTDENINVIAAFKNNRIKNRGKCLSLWFMLVFVPVLVNVHVCRCVSDLIPSLPQQSQLLLHLPGVAGCLGYLTPLQVSLCQQLLDVLLLLLQSLLQRRGARDLTGVASRCLRQLQRYSKKHSHLTFWMLSDAVFTYRYTRCVDCVRGKVSVLQSKLQIKNRTRWKKFTSCLKHKIQILLRKWPKYSKVNDEFPADAHAASAVTHGEVWGCVVWRRSVSLTSPARLGLPLIEEVAELSELMEEALGLLFRVDLLRELLALVGVVHGKPIRVTLWTGANRPYLGRHWKYLRRRTGGTNWNLSRHTDSWFKIYLYDVYAVKTDLFCSPGPRHSAVILPERFIQFHSTPLPFGKVCLSQKPNHSCLRPTNLHTKKNNHNYNGSL